MKIAELTPPKEFTPIHLSILIETKAELEDLLARLDLPAKDVDKYRGHPLYPWKANDAVSYELFLRLKNIWLTRYNTN